MSDHFANLEREPNGWSFFAGAVVLVALLLLCGVGFTSAVLGSLAITPAPVPLLQSQPSDK